VHDKLADALADVDLSVAFTRWLPDQQHPALPDIPSLLAHPVLQQMLGQPQRANHQQQQQQQQDLQDLQQRPQQQQQQHQQQRARIALVFGREEFGLSDDEVAACDIACAISIGRLQVSSSCNKLLALVGHQLSRLLCAAIASEPACTGQAVLSVVEEGQAAACRRL
jgi:hypothetical protein